MTDNCSKMVRRRVSLPQTPLSTPLLGTFPTPMFASPYRDSPLRERRLLPLLPLGHVLPTTHCYRNPHARLSQPDLYATIPQNSSPAYFYGAPVFGYGRRRMYSANRTPAASIPRRFLKRANQSDLAYRFQREREMNYSNESTPSREIEVDPVYLAIKQASGKYGGRKFSSSNNSATSSPRNLSQVSLQDSGFAELGAGANPMLGSTPQLDNAGRSTGRRRAPKLSTQMKSLSLDCQEMPPRLHGVNRSPLSMSPRTKLVARESRGKNSTSDLSDWDRDCSPCITSSRRSSAGLVSMGGHIVIHEYCPSSGSPLLLGERVRVVDNGDPDWLHGFRISDRTEHLISFPATCVSVFHAGEQAMRIQQNVFVAEQKLRMYRDQIVFAQPDTLSEGKVTVRTEHNAYAACPLTSLALL